MPKPNFYDIGDVVEMNASFTDLDGAPATPESVTCTVRAPDGTESTPEVTGTANPYTAECEPDQHGTWWYAFDGGPDVKASAENCFVVRLREVPR
jgi:hypothetical protein